MAPYDWAFTRTAHREFVKLDNQVQKRIVRWLNDRIVDSGNPRAWGKALEGDFGTFWRYRIGRYRLIADIKDHQFLVLIVKAGTREVIYK